MSLLPGKLRHTTLKNYKEPIRTVVNSPQVKKITISQYKFTRQKFI